ncbi:MAG: 16S rRNA (cytosine(1402)-N(4))-methyltransferase RsmH [Acidobacteria bacterium]|nr:16S rRNA (cytosine(1402)-N(4))-methyltransferase RsmH [Acidobacteriota bacterium]
MQHKSVMPREALEALALAPGHKAIDATSGLGGHSRLLAEAVGEAGLVCACDTDAESLELAKSNCSAFAGRMRFVHTRFSELPQKLQDILPADALLADFGTSMMHFTSGERGFSLMNDGPLDMRLDRSSDGPTAADLVNRLTERELADLIFITGERRSRQIARALVRGRPVNTMRRFAELVESVSPRTGKLHPATLSALSLRVATNREYEEIEALIRSLPILVRPGGRVALITFHSGEDGLAKALTRQLAKEGKAVLINKHVWTPSAEETRANPASRSAKMRVLEMKQPLGKQGETDHGYSGMDI